MGDFSLPVFSQVFTNRLWTPLLSTHLHMLFLVLEVHCFYTALQKSLKNVWTKIRCNRITSCINISVTIWTVSTDLLFFESQHIWRDSKLSHLNHSAPHDLEFTGNNQNRSCPGSLLLFLFNLNKQKLSETHERDFNRDYQLLATFLI
jgi:K+ transporter